MIPWRRLVPKWVHRWRWSFLVWSDAVPKGKLRRYTRKAAEGLREVGVLLVAFGPLEAVLGWESLENYVLFAIGTAGLGAALFAVALWIEWRYDDSE